MPDFTLFASRRSSRSVAAPKSLHVTEGKDQALEKTYVAKKPARFFFSQPKHTVPNQTLHRRNASDPCTLTLPPEYKNDSLEDLLATLCVRHEKFGEAHPKVGLTYNKIGTYHYRQGDFDSAASSYEEALRCFKLAYANNIQYKNENYYGTKGALTVATILGNIGTVLWRTGKLHEATAYLEEALQIQETLFAANSEIIDGIEIARTLYNLGIVHCLRGSFRRATLSLKRSRKIFESSTSQHGPLPLEISRVVDAIGKTHLLQGDAEGAMKYHLEALEMKKSLLDARHPSVLRSFVNVAEAHRLKGEAEKALSIYRQVLSAQKLALHRATSNPSRKAIAADIGDTLNAMGESMKERHN